MKNVLVTGGAGFIGSNFIRFALNQDPSVVITNLDSLTYAGNIHNLVDLPDEDRHTFIEGDICNSKLVNELLINNNIVEIVHFAAETHVDRSLLNPEIFYQTNIQGTLTLLEAARKCWGDQTELASKIFRFHHVSTDEVFGSLENDAQPFDELSPYAPNSPYAASKAASDHLVRTYSRAYGLPVTITASSNNLGPYQHPEKFIPQIILNALAGRSIPIYGEGDQIRDWISVEDNCRAIWAVLHEGRPGETYLVGGDNQPTNLEIARMICDQLDGLFPESQLVPHIGLIEHVSDRPGHDRRYAVNFQKISSELGWKPGLSLKEGINRTLCWYVDHMDWVNQVINSSDYQDWIQTHYD